MNNKYLPYILLNILMLFVLVVGGTTAYLMGWFSPKPKQAVTAALPEGALVADVEAEGEQLAEKDFSPEQAPSPEEKDNVKTGDAKHPQKKKKEKINLLPSNYAKLEKERKQVMKDFDRQREQAIDDYEDNTPQSKKRLVREAAIERWLERQEAWKTASAGSDNGK